MGKVDLIYQAIKAGVSAPKIIAKYGQKAYDAAKKVYKTKNKSKKIVKKLLDIPEKSLMKALKVNLGAIVVLPPIGAAYQAVQDKKKEKRATIREEARNPKKKITSSKIGLQKRGLRSGGAVNSRAIAKKYFKGGMV